LIAYQNYDAIEIDGAFNKATTLTVTYEDGDVYFYPVLQAGDFSFQPASIEGIAQADRQLHGGHNYFTLEATDASGYDITPVHIDIVFDTDSPVLTITSPTALLTRQSVITVAGTMSEPGQVTIDVGSWHGSTEIGSDHHFSMEVPLENDGANDIFVEAFDYAQNGAFQNLTVNRDVVPPTLNVSDLSVDGSGAITGSAGAVLDDVDPAPTVKVTSLGDGSSQSPTLGSDGGFSTVAFPVAQAGNPFKVTATDAAGNRSSVRIQSGASCFSNALTHNTSVTIAPAAVTVMGPNQTTMNFHVTRSDASFVEASIDYKTQQGTAADGPDYVGVTGTLDIPAGVTSMDIPVTVKGSNSTGSSKLFTLDVLGTHVSTSGVDFASRQSHAVGSNPRAVIAADLNGDGKLDLVTADNTPGEDGLNTANGTVSILINTTTTGSSSQPAYAAKLSLTAGHGPSAVVALDLNADQKPDLVVINHDGNDSQKLMVFMNTTTASNDVSFSGPYAFNVEGNPDSLTVADFNQDGKPDVAVGNEVMDASGQYIQGNVTVYLDATGQGDTSATLVAQMPSAIGFGPIFGTVFSIAASDVNGDGLPDIVTANDADGTLSVLMNTGTVDGSTTSFAEQQEVQVGGHPTSLETADINSDGKPDLSVVIDSGSLRVMVNETELRSTEAEFGGLKIIDIGGQLDSLVGADMDDDGNIDLLVGNTEVVGGIEGHTVTFLRNTTEPGDETPRFDIQSGTFVTGATPWPIIVADLNGDGRLDLVSADEDDDTVSVLAGLDFGVCVSPASATGTIQYNVVPPVVTITGPMGSTFESPYQVLSGRVSEPITSLTVNGTSIAVQGDNTFSANITLKPGANTYTVSAEDQFDNTGTASVTLTFNSPSLPAPIAQFIHITTTSGGVTITGDPGAAYPSSPGATVMVTVTDINTDDSRSSAVSDNGGFVVTPLSGYISDSFGVTVSLDGHQSPVVYLHGDDPALTLHVTSPCNADGCEVTVDADTVNIAGTYTGPADTGIAVNGKPASLVNGQFFLNNLPLTLGTNTINIIATTAGGLWTSEVLTINSLGPSALVLTASPTDTGIAPLTMNFHYQFQGNGATVQTLKMSYLGNGTDDVVTSDPNTILSHTYTDPGTYPAMLTIIDSNGQQHQALLPVSVQDMSIIGASIRKTWGDLGIALAKGNRAAAMNYLDYTAQQKYEPIFDVLLPNMPGIVGSFSQPLGISISNGYAQFTIVRVINGHAEVFFVYFVLGEDGVWRLDAM
jgi:hypothetical protein